MNNILKELIDYCEEFRYEIIRYEKNNLFEMTKCLVKVNEKEYIDLYYIEEKWINEYEAREKY